mmetsp:Transcript_84224/g.238652  ORF Transcript_84224/g.238652 Transcript_84224/m.238652 type:complete len:89 (+) Transcript_84224:123-389(+)
MKRLNVFSMCEIVWKILEITRRRIHPGCVWRCKATDASLIQVAAVEKDDILSTSHECLMPVSRTQVFATVCMFQATSCRCSIFPSSGK